MFFRGVKFHELLLHFMRGAKAEALSWGWGKIRRSIGIVASEGVGDEEMWDGQGGMAESNRNHDLRAQLCASCQ